MDLILRALKIKSTENQKDDCSIKQTEEPQSIKQKSSFPENLSLEEFEQMLITDMQYITRRR